MKQVVEKREKMINEVSSRVEPIAEEVYHEKLKKLFGNLVKGFLKDEMLLKHRAEHGGIDIF